LRTSFERPNLVALRELVTKQRPFVSMLLNSLIFNIAFWMAMPLQPIYFIRDLGAADGWIGLWTAILSAGAILGALVWRRLIDRNGVGWALLCSAVLSAPYYILIGVFPDLTLILLFALLAGFINAQTRRSCIASSVSGTSLIVMVIKLLHSR
jgi:Na+/melibiose symporter-like transporter